jgi:hypothetical protein
VDVPHDCVPAIDDSARFRRTCVLPSVTDWSVPPSVEGEGQALPVLRRGAFCVSLELAFVSLCVLPGPDARRLRGVPLLACPRQFPALAHECTRCCSTVQGESVSQSRRPR